MRQKLQFGIAAFLGAIIGAPLFAIAQDWYQHSGVPVQRSPLSSAPLRSEFQAIEQAFNKLPILTGNENRIVRVNSTGTGLEASAAGIAISEGGTGATDAAGARTNLGLVIGTTVQPYSNMLTSLAGLTPTAGNMIMGSGTGWLSVNSTTVRTQIGAAPLSHVHSGGDITSGTISASLIPQQAVTQYEAALGTTNPTANTIARRDGSGYLKAVYFNSSAYAFEDPPSFHSVIVEQSQDGYMRKASNAHVMRRLALTWTIQSDPGTTPTGTPGQVFAYY